MKSAKQIMSYIKANEITTTKVYKMSLAKKHKKHSRTIIRSNSVINHRIRPVKTKRKRNRTLNTIQTIVAANKLHKRLLIVT